jgi:hypothetical protein
VGIGGIFLDSSKVMAPSALEWQRFRSDWAACKLLRNGGRAGTRTLDILLRRQVLNGSLWKTFDSKLFVFSGLWEIAVLAMEVLQGYS